MAKRSSLVAAFGFALVMLRPAMAFAQLENFVQAVRELAVASGQAEPSRTEGVRAAATRMKSALGVWDDHVAALASRVDRELETAPDSRAFQLHVERGVAYRTRGRVSDALREFDAAAALRPASSDMQVLRALTLEAVGRTADAHQAFRTAWTLDSRNPIKAYYVLQRSALTTHADRDRALAQLTDFYRRLPVDAPQPDTAPFVVLDVISENLSSTPVIADDATKDGFAMLTAGKYREGVAALTTVHAPAAAADSPLASFARGQTAEADNRPADARRHYQAALNGTLIGRSTLYVALGRLAQVEGDLAGAIDALQRATHLHPNDPTIHREAADTYAASGRADDAFCELIAALLIDPRDMQAHAAIGQLHLNEGRDTDAVSAFTRALELKPDGYQVRYALATALMRLGKTAEAAVQLEIFERASRELLERRRRGIASEVEKEEAARRGVATQGGVR